MRGGGKCKGKDKGSAVCGEVDYWEGEGGDER